jgi:hypothetical protein
MTIDKKLAELQNLSQIISLDSWRTATNWQGADVVITEAPQRLFWKGVGT